MLYLGHFSFEQTERKRREPAQVRHGYFTCVAEADDIDGALAKLERLIRKLHEESELFEDAAQIYLQACVEIRSVPQGGFLAFYNMREGEDLGGISTAIREATESEAVAFSADAADDEDGEELHEMKPFVVFEPSRRRNRAGSDRRLRIVSKS